MPNATSAQWFAERRPRLRAGVGFAGSQFRQLVGDAVPAAVDIRLDLSDLSESPQDRLGEVMVHRFVTLWEQPPGNEILLTLLRAAAADDQVATDRIRHVFAEQVMPAVLRAGDPQDAPHRAGLVVTQLLGLALCRYVLRLPPVVAMTEEQLVRDVGATVQRYLNQTCRS